MSAKTFKLVIISILLAITALLPGELFQGYMDQYNDFYETSFYLQSGKTAEEMNLDLSSAAETYDIHIFKIYTRSKTTYSVCLDIYADDAMVQILSSQYCIREGTYQSLFSGSTEINIYPFSDIPDDLMEEDEVYYLYGDYDDTVLFKQSLVDIICRELDNEPITDTVTNPVIVFYNHEQDIPAGELLYEFFLGMVDDSDGQWSEYASANGISYMGTNAWDYFCYRWEALSRTVLVNLVAVVIMAVLMILSVYVVIRMEFQVNAQEVACKKIYGYTNLQRFRKLYGLTVVSAVICLIGLIVLKCVGYSVPLRYVFPALLLFALIECAFISLQIAFYDRKNLQNILKGGNV